MAHASNEGGLRCDSPASGQFALTVVTICFNDLAGLRLTAESVKRNLSENVEFIVVDGGSTDGTVEYLQSLSFIHYWISEPDGGIYDAMNKGVALAHGHGLLFLNAGDFIEGTIPLGQLSAPCFLEVWYRDPLRRFRPIPVKHVAKGMPNCHQGVVFENKALLYNADYRIAADYDFFIRHGYNHFLPMFKASGRVIFDSSGVSSTRLAERDSEIGAIIKHYYGWHWAALFNVKAALRRSIKLILNWMRS